MLLADRNIQHSGHSTDLQLQNNFSGQSCNPKVHKRFHKLLSLLTK